VNDSIKTWVAEVEEAYADKRDMTDLIARFTAEPDETKIAIWAVLTTPGIANIEFAKFVYRHFSRPVLAIFGTVI